MDLSATTERQTTVSSLPKGPRLLRGEERRARWIKDVIENDFDSAFPSDESANIIVEGGGSHGPLEAAVTVELLLRANLWWVAARHRKTTRAAVLIRRMAKYLLKVVPKGQSIIVVASTPEQEKLCSRIGLRKVEGVMYRIDR